MYLWLLCALYRFQPTVGLHAELPAAGPWAGSRTVCCGGPRSQRQKWLCGAVHFTFHKPTKRCSQKSNVHIIGHSSLWPASGYLCVYDILSSSQVIDTFICWRQTVPVCRQPHSSSMLKWPAKCPSKRCPSVSPLQRARYDVHLNLMETCIFWKTKRFGEGALNVSRERESSAVAASRLPRPDFQVVQFARSRYRRRAVVFQRRGSTLALSKWIGCGWIMNPWWTVGDLVRAQWSGNRVRRIVASEKDQRGTRF